MPTKKGRRRKRPVNSNYLYNLHKHSPGKVSSLLGRIENRLVEAEPAAAPKPPPRDAFTATCTEGAAARPQNPRHVRLLAPPAVWETEVRYNSDSPVRRLERASRYVERNTSCTQRVMIHVGGAVHTVCCLEGVTRARDIIKALQGSVKDPSQKIAYLEVRPASSGGGALGSEELPPEEARRLSGEQLMSECCGDEDLRAVLKTRRRGNPPASSRAHQRMPFNGIWESF